MSYPARTSCSPGSGSYSGTNGSNSCCGLTLLIAGPDVGKTGAGIWSVGIRKLHVSSRPLCDERALASRLFALEFVSERAGVIDLAQAFDDAPRMDSQRSHLDVS